MLAISTTFSTGSCGAARAESAPPGDLPSDLQFEEPGPVVLEDLTTQNSLTHLMPDGTLSTTMYGSPVLLENENGSWEAVDNTFVDAPGEAFIAQTAEADYVAKIPSDPTITPVRFITDGAWISFRLHGQDEGEPSIEGSVATYEDGAGSVVVEATPSGIKESIVLDAAPKVSQLAYKYTIAASPGISATLSTQSEVEFRNQSGELVASIPAGVMFDSAQPVANESPDIKYGLVARASDWVLTVTPNMDWLTAEERIW